MNLLSVIVQIRSINTHFYITLINSSASTTKRGKNTNCPSIKHARFDIASQIQFIIYIEFLGRISIFHFLFLAPSVCSPDVRCQEPSDVAVSTAAKAVKTMVFYLLTNAAVTKRNDLNYIKHIHYLDCSYEYISTVTVPTESVK